VASHLILLGGGRSSRYGKDKLREKILNRYVLDVLFSSIPYKLFKTIVWVGSPNVVSERYRDQLIYASPGDTRHKSVRKGISLIEFDDDDKILIHDGARFLASRSLFERVLAHLDVCSAVYPAIPPTDALRHHGEDGIKTVSREHIYRVQTPQGFRGSVMRYILSQNADDVYDEIMLAEEGGFSICHVRGEVTNIKLTYGEDIHDIESCVRRLYPPTGIGIGFDTHLIGKGGSLYVGGVQVSDEFYSIGWSDGDALLHAIVDAILSSYGVSADIGELFPARDDKYKGISSSRLVEEVVNTYGPVESISAVVVLSMVKLKPFRSDIIESIKRLTGANQVALTFKTAEGLREDLYMAYVVAVRRG